MTIADTSQTAATHWAERLLDSEQQALVRLLHDDLGQNLVAIRSFAAAIAEQSADTPGDTGELAEMIREAAEFAYRSSYDLMQELRAQYMADREIGDALETCLAESRLRENQIDYSCRVDPALNGLDTATRAFILRSVRCCANLCKSLQHCATIAIELRGGARDGTAALALSLELDGKSEGLDPEHFSVVALGERTAAIAGEMCLDAGDDGCCRRLELHFAPLDGSDGAQS